MFALLWIRHTCALPVIEYIYRRRRYGDTEICLHGCKSVFITMSHVIWHMCDTCHMTKVVRSDITAKERVTKLSGMWHGSVAKIPVAVHYKPVYVALMEMYDVEANASLMFVSLWYTVYALTFTRLKFHSFHRSATIRESFIPRKHTQGFVSPAWDYATVKVKLREP